MREREELAARWREEAEARKREEAEAREREEAAAREREELAARERAEAAARDREAVAARERAEAEARQREEAEARRREELAAREREAAARTAATLAGKVAAANSRPELRPFASSPAVPAQVRPPSYGALENRAAAAPAVPVVDSHSPTAFQKLGANRVAIAGIAIGAVALLVVIAGLTYAFWPSQPDEQPQHVLASNETTTPTPEVPTASPYATVENVSGPSPARPSPSPRKSPSPGQSSTYEPAPTAEPTRPPPTPEPTRPPATPGNTGPVKGGLLNGKAISLPKPAYPPMAKSAHAQGTVYVQVTIDEYGNVISANAMSGHPLLLGAAVQAARSAKFSPTKLYGQAVKVTGVLTYHFVAQ